MTKKTKIINGSVFFLWLALISLLLYRNYAGTPLEQSQALEGTFTKVAHWYDIYAGPRKIGFAGTTYEKVGDEITIIHEREMKTEKEGHEKLLLERMKCLSDSVYSIRSFEYSSHYEDEKGTKITGKVDKENVIFFIESSEKRKVFTIPKSRNFYLPVTFLPALARQKPALNSVLIVPLLDIINFKIIDFRVVLEEIRPVKVGINILSLYKFRAGNFIWWCNEKGIPLKEENPTGINLYSENEVIAADSSSWLLFDYTGLPFFKSNKLIPDTDKLVRLKLRIKGYKLDPYLYTNSAVTLDNDILVIKKSKIPDKTFKLPYTESNYREYVNPDAWVSSNFKPLKETGQIYARANKYDSVFFAQSLTSYLYNIIKTWPLFAVRNAEDILRSLNGDFLERTIMYATYARAGGLPTRLTGGLVYKNGYFYFHTWPEIWLGKWVPVDPTFNQFPADVTHIPLKTGNIKDLTSSVDDLKSLTIEVLEAL